MSCPQCGHSYAHHDNCPAGNALGDIRNGVDRVASASEKQSVLQQKIADTGAMQLAELKRQTELAREQLQQAHQMTALLQNIGQLLQKQISMALIQGALSQSLFEAEHHLRNILTWAQEDRFAAGVLAYTVIRRYGADGVSAQEFQRSEDKRAWHAVTQHMMGLWSALGADLTQLELARRYIRAVDELTWFLGQLGRDPERTLLSLRERIEKATEALRKGPLLRVATGPRPELLA
jgi:hypothetical protein